MDTQDAPPKDCSEKPDSFGTKDPSQSPEPERSTGPSTASGKKNSSRNAIKHGLFSKDLVIRPADIKIRANSILGGRESMSVTSHSVQWRNTGWR